MFKQGGRRGCFQQLKIGFVRNKTKTIHDDAITVLFCFGLLNYIISNSLLRVMCECLLSKILIYKTIVCKFPSQDQILLHLFLIFVCNLAHQIIFILSYFFATCFIYIFAIFCKLSLQDARTVLTLDCLPLFLNATLPSSLVSQFLSPSLVLLEEFFVFSLKCISTDSWNNFCEDDPTWLLSVAVAATGSSQTWSHVVAAAGESYTCGRTVCPFGGLFLTYLHFYFHFCILLVDL